MDMQTFFGTACNWKVHRLFLPANSSDAELRALCKAILRVKHHRLLLTSIGIPTSKPTKSYEENGAVVHSVLSHQINTRLRHVNIPICYLHHDHGNGPHESKSAPSRIQFANMDTKLESGTYLMRSSSISMGPVYLSQLPHDQYDILTSLAPLSC